MLGFIYRLVFDYDQEHGMRPNLLYLNHEHAKRLTDDFDHQYDLHTIMGILNMEIIIEKEIIHPHVGWMRMVHQRAV